MSKGYSRMPSSSRTIACYMLKNVIADWVSSMAIYCIEHLKYLNISSFYAEDKVKIIGAYQFATMVLF
jgi:hypothetical protein